MLGSWLRDFSLKFKKTVVSRSSGYVLVHLITHRNDAVLKQSCPDLTRTWRSSSGGNILARFWSQVSGETMDHVKNNCRRLEGVVLELFSKLGWNFRNRIDL